MNFYRHHLINNIHIPNILNTLNLWLKNLNTDFTLNHCLFGYVKLTKNAVSDKYKHSG